MGKKKFWEILSFICTLIVIASAAAEIYIVNTSEDAPSKLSMTIWLINLIIWVVLCLVCSNAGKFWKDSYETLSDSYDDLSQQYDHLMKIAEDVNASSIKQNKLCEEISLNNKDTIRQWNDTIQEAKKLVEDRHKLLLALAESNPRHPVLQELMEEFEKRKLEKEAKEAESKISE